MYIFVQTEEDFKEYKRYWDEIANLVLKPASNVSEARNNILDYFPAGTRVVMMDDDISDIVDANGLSAFDDASSLKAFFNKAFTMCEFLGTTLWGMYPTPNSYYMSKRPELVTRALIIGTVMGVIVENGVRFDPEMTLKEDLDFTCKILKLHGKIVRFDRYAPVHLTQSPGGCYAWWKKSDENARMCKLLLEKHPDLLKPHPRRPNEVWLVNRREDVG